MSRNSRELKQSYAREVELPANQEVLIGPLKNSIGQTRAYAIELFNKRTDCVDMKFGEIDNLVTRPD